MPMGQSRTVIRGLIEVAPRIIDRYTRWIGVDGMDMVVEAFREVENSIWLKVLQKSSARVYILRSFGSSGVLNGPGILEAVVTSWNISTRARCSERFIKVMWIGLLGLRHNQGFKS